MSNCVLKMEINTWKRYEYYRKSIKGKFEGRYEDCIPWSDLHSPDEVTPALIYPDGDMIWYFEGKKHRLTGPAQINNDGYIAFWLNDVCYYQDIKKYLINHPNQEYEFKLAMVKKYGDLADFIVNKNSYYPNIFQQIINFF